MKNLLRKFNLSFGRHEISGSLGDMGTFLPLVAGLVNRCGMDLGHILFFAGAMNLATGLIFGIPMPVQPMKAIATVAITEGMGRDVVIAAGIAAGVTLLILSISRLMNVVHSLIPKAVIRGLQLAIGLKLAFKGFEMIIGTGKLIAPDSIATALVCSGIALLTFSYRKLPGALVIFMLGIGILLVGRPTVLSSITLGWQLPYLIVPSLTDFTKGILSGTLPQIPLTVANSVIAVCALSVDLFPRRVLEARRVTVSVALMNLISCPLGGMPMCHGSGGLAAQYRFGARTGGSVVFLGLAKMLLAVTFGSSLLLIITNYPLSILGVLLAFSGYELGSVCRDQKKTREIVIMGLTTISCLTINIAAGTAIGALAALLLPGKQSAGELIGVDEKDGKEEECVATGKA